MADKEYIELFDKYYQGEMTADEVDELNVQLALDDKMNAAFQEYYSIMETLALEEKKQLKQILIEHENTLPPIKDSGSKWNNLWKIVGLVFIVGIVGSLAYYLNRPSQEEMIFSQNLSHFPNVVSIKGASNINYFNEAMENYDYENYDVATQQFELYLNSEPNDENALFYCGISYLFSKDASKAIEKLKQVQSSNFYENNPQYWYLSLAYIQSEQQDKAVQLLTEIQTQQWHNHPKVKKLLEQLKD